MKKRHRIKNVVVHEKGIYIQTCSGAGSFYVFSKFGWHKLQIQAKHLLPFFIKSPLILEQLKEDVIGRYIYGRRVERETVIGDRVLTNIDIV